MNKIKVLWLASWYPNKENPSIGDFIQRQAVATAPLVEIKVLCFVASSSVDKTEIDSITHHSSLKEIIVYYPNAEGKYLYRIRKKYNYFKAVSSGLKEAHNQGWRPDILHLHILFPLAWVALFDQRWSRLPLIVSEHASHYALKNLPLSAITRAFGKATLQVAKAVVVVSQSLVESMKMKGFFGNFVIIPNVVELTSVPKSINRTGIFKWVHASTLAPEIKNIDGLLRVIKELVDNGYNVHLTLLGGSEVSQQLYTKEVHRLGLEAVVRLESELSHKEALAMMAQHDAMVHFSNYETFGLSVLEALRLGLPVITTDTGVAGDWIDERSGVIVPVKDEQALYKGMIKIMNNYTDYDTEHLAKRMDNTLNAEAIGKAIYDLYAETMKSCSK